MLYSLEFKSSFKSIITSSISSTGRAVFPNSGIISNQKISHIHTKDPNLSLNNLL